MDRIEYDVVIPDLTVEMLNQLLIWIEEIWGGVDLITIKVHPTRIDTTPPTH